VGPAGQRGRRRGAIAGGRVGNGPHGPDGERGARGRGEKDWAGNGPAEGGIFLFLFSISISYFYFYFFYLLFLLNNYLAIYS
jgi:hypothetical protein